MAVVFNKKIIFSLCGLLLLSACSEEKPREPMSFSLKNEEQIVLQPANFSDFNGWKDDDLSDLIPAFEKSCEKISKQKSEFLYNATIKIPTAEYQHICTLFLDKNIKTSRQFKNFLKDNFSPWAVMENGSTEGRFTSYYQTKIRVSETKDDVYKYPVFGKPDDLIAVELQKFSADLPPKRLMGRVQNGELVPYYTRAEIENNPAISENYPVLLWGDNPVDIYFMHIQGSALAELPDGRSLSLSYAGNNGQSFKGIGSILLENNKLEKGKASMSDVKIWLENNYEEAKEYMNQNNRYVFYHISDNIGMLGSQGVVLTPQRSLAVDKEIIPFGSILWLETKGPDNEPLNKAVIAQDTGEAIKGAVRGDYFWGYGDEALKASGKMSSAGRYYILIPKKND